MKSDFMGLYDDKTIQRLWSKVNRGAANDCWEWTGLRRGGYGIMSANGKSSTGAHRIACYLKYGPAPDGKPQAMHSCDNRACCNPDHLSWGSNQDNAIDCATKGRASAAKLRPHQVLEVRALRREGKSLRFIAKIYGVNNTSILKCVRGTTYQNIRENPPAANDNQAGERKAS